MLGVEQQGPMTRPREGSLGHTPTHTIYALSYHLHKPHNLQHTYYSPEPQSKIHMLAPSTHIL